MKQKIITKENPILRKQTEEVLDFGIETQNIIDDMIETMRKENGIGLAAPQIGLSKKIFVCEFSPKEDSGLSGFPLTVFINPKIIKSSKKLATMVEGCLSFPGMELLVKRPESIEIEGFDRYGKKIIVRASGLYARAIQHENDHLNSTLLTDHLEEIDLAFIGTGDLGLEALELLHADSQYNVKVVITSKIVSKQKNRKAPINPIKELAKNLGINVLEVENINDPKIIETIKRSHIKLGVMADFGQIIKKEVLDIFSMGLINIHPSLLPKYRGPSPVQQTILDGNKEAGVSLILTGEKMDAGDLISQAKIRLAGTETTTILKQYLGEIGANLLLNTLSYYVSGDLKPVRQDDDKASYTRLFKPENGFVDENTSEAEVERKVRAFDKWPKVYTVSNGKRVQITAAHLDEDKKLVIDRVKPEGKNEMNYSDYLLGYKHALTFRR